MVVTDKTHWLSVASALSAFWTAGEGPNASNVREAIGAAGIEYEDVKGANKKDTIANAVQRSSPAHKKTVVTELVDLLAGGSYFQQGTSWYQPKRFRSFKLPFKGWIAPLATMAPGSGMSRAATKSQNLLNNQQL